jgi:hypothetical protein
MIRMLRLPSLVPVVLLAVAVASPVQAAQSRSKPKTAPETFTASAQVHTAAGGTGGMITIHVDRYTPENERKTMTDALKHGGYPAFLPVLRKAPDVGYVSIGDVKTVLRWAREEPTPKGRVITLVTEAPVFFVGGGRVDARSRAGFELAIVRLTVDDYGYGTGTMAGAAKVKPDGSGGVQVEDYGDQPIKLTFVRPESP